MMTITADSASRAAPVGGSGDLRVCTLLPSATEIAYLIGLGDQVVGVTHECDYPSDVREKRVVVSSRIDKSATSSDIDTQVRDTRLHGMAVYELDEAAIRELSPTVIVTQGLCEVCALPYETVAEVAARLEPQPGIVSLNPTSLDDVFDDIVRVGRATGAEEEARLAVESLRRRVAAVRRQVSGLPRRRVLCVEWLDPLMIGGHWVPEMVELAGGEDVLGAPGEPTRVVALQEAIAAAPEVVLLMPCGYDVAATLTEAYRLGLLRKLSETPAVATGEIYAMDANSHFSRSGPRLVDGLEVMARVVHGDGLVGAGAARRLV